MADFDESAIRSPRTPPTTIGVGEVEPWTVWSAAGALVVLACVGLIMGVRGGHPLSGVGMSLQTGEALDAATTKAAAPAQAMPKDQQWSTLSGPEVVVQSAAPVKTAAAEDSESDAAVSDEPVATTAADQPEIATPPPLAIPPPPSTATPLVTPVTPAPPTTEPTTP